MTTIKKQELLDAFAREISLGSYKSWKENKQSLRAYIAHVSTKAYIKKMQSLAALAEKMSKVKK